LNARPRSLLRGRLAAALGATVLAIAAPAAALNIENGDLVGIFQKGGTEVIVNLGPATPGSMLDLDPGTFNQPGFGNSVAGAKFVGLAVEDPGRTVNCCGGGPFPDENVIYTSLVLNPMPDDSQIEQAMNIMDTELPSNAWFWQLRQLPGTDQDVIETTAVNSYEGNLGLGTDAIANFIGFSTAGVFDGNGHLTMPVYSAVRGYESFGGPPAEYMQIATVAIDNTSIDFQPAPEAPAILGTLVAGLTLFGLRARRPRPA
jgi:hypothetical protein